MCVQGYDKAFIRRIQYKHMLAWRHFSQISKMAEFLKSNQDAGLDAALNSGDGADGGDGGGCSSDGQASSDAVQLEPKPYPQDGVNK